MNTLAAATISAFLVASNIIPIPQTKQNVPIPETPVEIVTEVNRTWPPEGTYENPFYTKPLEIQEATTAAKEAGVFFVEYVNQERNKFVNYADGYSFSIPKNMFVTDMSYTGLRSVLEDTNRRLEIYKETVPSVASYYNYSYRFLNNKDDHITEYIHSTKIGAYRANITQWSRPALSRVPKDKNYYASVDIFVKNTVYNFFFSSDVPFYQCGGYLEMLQDFKVFTPTASHSNRICQETTDNNWNEETKQFFETHFSPDSKLTWGIFEPAAPYYSLTQLNNLESQLDYNFHYLLVYSEITKTYGAYNIRHALDNARNKGAVVELTLQTTAQGSGEGNMMYDVLDGKYDNFLNKYAQAIAQFQHPVMFRLCNEMNGDWCQYSAFHTSRDTQIFVQFYQYIYRIFEQNGATANTIWIWNPNGKSFPNYAWNQELAYYPGDRYAHIVGLTAYNTGTYYKDEHWKSFKDLYDAIYPKAAAQYRQPLMITEFASSSVGGNKEQWVRDMFDVLPHYPRLKAAIWWDGCDYDSHGNISRPYFIDETPELLQIFKENLQNY